ncbi:MAG: hypothetical protein K6T83_16885 [Alicyclobacillus sp.]|nr:hypothetical protein [Alicyclobacillus sp.]
MKCAISFGCLVLGLFLINAVFSYQNKHIDPRFIHILRFQIVMIPVFLASSMLIGYGIRYGYNAAGNLGYVLAASKVIEIAISLLMGYLFMHEVPSRNAWIGFAIVCFGMVVAKL